MIKKLHLGYITFVFILISCFLMQTATVNAAYSASKGTNYYLKIAGKKQKKKCIVATANGKSITSPAPGFIRSSTSMYSAYYVLGKPSSLGVSYSYSYSANKRIILKRGSKKLTLYCGKTYGYLNGKKITVSMAPQRVYSYKMKKYYIYVPGEFCANQLGLKYSWNNSKLTGAFSTSSTTTTASVSSSSSSGSVISGTRVTASSSKYSLRIKKPSGMSSDFAVLDQYEKKRLRFKIKGNYKSHFSSSSNRYAKSSYSSYSVSYSNGYTYVYIKPSSSSIKGFAVSQTSSYIYIYWASPKTIYKNIVVIDAGHGGSDSGAVGNGYKEKDLTLSIVLAAKSYFDKNSSYKVYYTRTSDTYPSLTERSTLANNVGADRFISVHINSASASAHGTETLYNSSGYKSTSGLTSYKWSSKIHSYIKSATGFTNRGLKNRPELSVLRKTQTAASLTEIGFISNKTEAKTMKSNTTKYGKAVYNAIVNSFSVYPSKR